MRIIHNEDIYNDTYGRERMYLALQQRYEEGKSDIPVPSEGTVRKIMEKSELYISHAEKQME